MSAMTKRWNQRPVSERKCFLHTERLRCFGRNAALEVAGETTRCPRPLDSGVGNDAELEASEAVIMGEAFASFGSVLRKPVLEPSWDISEANINYTRKHGESRVRRCPSMVCKMGGAVSIVP